MIFDLLWLDGHSLLEPPYAERRARARGARARRRALADARPPSATARALLAATREQGLEGIVAKRLDSPYGPAARSAAGSRSRTSSARSW